MAPQDGKSVAPIPAAPQSAVVVRSMLKFGLAHLEVGKPPPSVGSAKYLAPEQLKQEFGEVGPATDLYCLGFKALELLKGPGFDTLFPGVGAGFIDVEIAWLRWHSSANLTLPSAGTLVPGLPDDLVAVLDRLLRKNVKERCPDAAAALHDLVPAMRKSPSAPAANPIVAANSPVKPAGAMAWLNQQLGKKRVFLTVLAVVLTPVILLALWPDTGDKNGLTAQPNPLQKTVVPLELPAQRYALIIGVRKSSPALPAFVHAESDAETLARVLQVGGFTADKVSVLTETRGKAAPADMPTAANIKQVLAGLRAGKTLADTQVVALIGQAVELVDEGYFCPKGSDPADPRTLVAFTEVMQALEKAPPGKKLLILDCWRKDWQSTDRPARLRRWNKPPPPGVSILYACAPGQTGYEHVTYRHSAFGHFLSQGLLGEAGRPDVPGDKLADYCKRAVVEYVGKENRDARQAPLMVSGASYEPWPITAPGKTDDYLLGCALLEKKDYRKAIDAFNRAEKDLPTFVDLFLRRSEAYYHSKQYEQAGADCRAVLKLDAANAAAYAQLAECQAAPPAKDFAAAVKNFTRAIALDPEYALAYNARGVAFIASRDYEAAVKDFSEALRLHPQLAFPWGNRGIAQANLKLWDNAIADFDKAIALDDEQAFLFAQRGNAWNMKEQPQRAIEDYTKALKLDPGKWQWWNTCGKLRVQAKDLDNAVSDLKRAIDLKPKYKEAWLNLGNAYFEQQKYSFAADALNQAVTIDPKYVLAHRQLSLVYRQLNDPQKAKVHQKIASELEMK